MNDISDKARQLAAEIESRQWTPDPSNPLVTPFTRKLGLPDTLLAKLWAIRKIDPSVGPANINLGYALRPDIHLRNYQTQMVAHLMLMPRMIVGDAVGLGKAQPLDSKVLTPSGWKLMGDLKVGDAVCDPDGGVGYVEGVFPQGVKQVYRVTTEDGRNAESCKEHLWTVVTIEDLHRVGGIATLTLQQIMNRGLSHIPSEADTPIWGFHLPIHEASRRVGGSQLPTRPLVSVEPSRVTECQCIRVSTKRHLYVTDDYIVTHNTITAIAGMGYHLQKRPNTKFIVMTTRSTTYQWRNEIVRFSGILKPYVMKDAYKGSKSNAARLQQFQDFLKGDKKNVMVCKYTSLIGKRKKIEGEFDENGDRVYGGKERVSQEILALQRILEDHDGPVVLILDEAHKFKSTTGQIRSLVMHISKHASRVWAMTATAIKNSLDEFYSISAAIGIRPFGSMTNFREDYCIYRNVHVGRGIRKPTLVGYRNVKDFKMGIRPFFYGRSQAQVKEPLPRLTTVFHQLDMDDKQTKLLLEDIPSGEFILPPSVKRVAGEIELVERDPSNLMTLLSVSQLVTNHPCLLDPEDIKGFRTTYLSPKEESLLDLLDGDLKGENVICYTKFRSWINRLQWLSENGKLGDRKFLRITGAENEKQRENARLKFQAVDNGYDCIYINSAAIEGVNLQQAAHMVCLDVPWSWGDMQQLVGRMVRMASPHSACTLHILACKGTIDEYAIETLRSKKGVFEVILGESFSQGILTDSQEVDLTSGLDDLSQDQDDFKQMLQAHAKPLQLGKFVMGEILASTKSGRRKRTLIDKGAGDSNRSEKVSLRVLEKEWGVESI